VAEAGRQCAVQGRWAIILSRPANTVTIMKPRIARVNITKRVGPPYIYAALYSTEYRGDKRQCDVTLERRRAEQRNKPRYMTSQ